MRLSLLVFVFSTPIDMSTRNNESIQSNASKEDEKAAALLTGENDKDTTAPTTEDRGRPLPRHQEITTITTSDRGGSASVRRLLRHAHLDDLMESFVWVPMASIGGNILAAGLLSLWTVDDASADCARVVQQAQRMSTMVSTAAISIVTLTFSLTVLSIQIAAQSYSPRLLEDFLKDPVAKWVISANLGAYAYCYTVEYFVPTSDECSDEGNGVPHVMIHFLSAHMVAILFSFVEFIHFFTNGFRIEKITSRAAESSMRAAKDLSELPQSNKTEESSLLRVPKSAYKVLADKSGYVNSFCLHNILSMAKNLDVCVRYTYQIGEFVNEGTVLAYVWDSHTDGDTTPIEDRVLKWAGKSSGRIDKKKNPWENVVESILGNLVAKGVKISKVRSSDLDVTLGIQQLSDIAVRALSQAINDPHTAIQCMDTLSDLLARLGVMELGIPSVRDSTGIVRACAPRRSFAFLLSLLDSIRRYGASDLNVCRRGIRLFGDLACILVRAQRIDRVVPVVAQLQQWMLVACEAFPNMSPERQSLQELYGHVLDAITDAEDQFVDKPEVVSRDMQFLNTTLRMSDRNMKTKPKEWDVLQVQMESAKALATESAKALEESA